MQRDTAVRVLNNAPLRVFTHVQCLGEITDVEPGQLACLERLVLGDNSIRGEPFALHCLTFVVHYHSPSFKFRGIMPTKVRIPRVPACRRPIAAVETSFASE